MERVEQAKETKASNVRGRLGEQPMAEGCSCKEKWTGSDLEQTPPAHARSAVEGGMCAKVWVTKESPARVEQIK
eukprot:12414917-Karenia_brevis.AAC.1